MEVAALNVQQAMAQSSIAMSMVKQNAKTEKAIVDLVATATNGRGQNIDISV
jgi:hypothetical protein